jgi:DNA-binding SARP family transcriptional activator
VQGTPFWADSLERQPAFLQAGALEADGRWQELMSFAQSWTKTAPHDGQAWYALAKAAVKTGDQATAQSAFKAATEKGLSVPASKLIQAGEQP